MYRTLLKWSVRDIRARWLQVAAIALIISIGTGSFASFNSMTRWRRASNDASYNVLNVHDLRARLGNGAFHPMGTLKDAALEIEHSHWIEALEERVIIPTQVDAPTSDGDVLVRGRLIGVDLTGEGPRVDAIYPQRGRTLAEGDAGADVVMLEYNFASHYSLPDEGAVRLAGGDPFTYVGQALQPEYFMIVTNDGGFLAQARFAAVFTSIETAGRIAGQPGSTNDLVIRLTEEADRDVVQSELAAHLSSLGAEVVTIDDDDSFNQVNKDVEGDQATTMVISVVLLLGAVFAGFNLTTRMVEAQRREIGIGMALGVPRLVLAARPMLVSAQIALLGAIFGVGVGLVVGNLLRSIMEDLLPMPIIETPFQFDIFLGAALLGMVAPIAAIAYPVWRAVSVPPVQAIRTGHLSARGWGLSPLLRRVPIPGGTLARIPFGNILRAPQRTILTAVGIGAIITVLIGTLGMIDSFFAAGDQSERTLLGHAPDRVLVELDALQPVQSGAYRAVAESPKLSRAEPVTRIVGTLVGDEDSIDVLIDFVDFSSDLWVPDVVEGESVHGGETGVLLTRKAGEDLGIGIGDMVTLRHARRDGGSFSTVETQVPLLGFHGHAFRTFGYMDRGQLAIAGLDGMANQVSANPVEGLSPNDVGRALFDESGVASVQPVLSIATAFNDAIGDFATILYVFVGVGLVITGLISFNSAIISIDERRREHATMFAYGVPVRTIVRISVVQNFVLGLVSTALGLAGGFVFIEWMIGFIVPRSMPDLGLERTLSLQSVAITFLVGTIVVAATPLLAVRRLRRMDIPSTLRVME